jgi:hypothetical protein
MTPPQLPAVLSKCWKLMALKGSLGILLGLAAGITPAYLNLQSFDRFGLSMFLEAATLIAFLILYLGLYALLDGVCAFTMGFRLYGQMCRCGPCWGRGSSVWAWARRFGYGPVS